MSGCGKLTECPLIYTYYIDMYYYLVFKFVRFVSSEARMRTWMGALMMTGTAQVVMIKSRAQSQRGGPSLAVSLILEFF